MKAPPIVASSVMRGTELTVTIRVQRLWALRLRLWIATRLIALTGWVGRFHTKVVVEERPL